MTPSLSLLLAPLAVAAAPDAAHHLAQAELFARRGWTDDAWREIRAALAAPGGADDPTIRALAAVLAWDQRLALTAAEHHEAVSRLHPDPATAERARAEAQALRRQFARLVIEAPHEGMATRVQLEGGPRLFDADTRQYAQDVTLRLRARDVLPVSVELPIGGWTVNGHAVELRAGEEARLSLPMDAIGRKGMSALQVLRLEVAGGLQLAAGARAEALRPSPTLEIGLTLPSGGWLIGITASGTLQGTRGADNVTRQDPSAFAVGGRVGSELFTSTPLAIRPAVTLRGLRQPGLTPTCAASGCTGDLVTGWQLAPGGELAIDYREAGRTTAFGSGVRLAADLPIGAADGTLAVTALLRVMGDLSFAF
jgi:hypothetical protein